MRPRFRLSRSPRSVLTGSSQGLLARVARGLLACALIGGVSLERAAGEEPTIVVERQPLLAQTRRLESALGFLGSPLSGATRAALERARQLDSDAEVTRAVREALRPQVFARLVIDADGASRLEPAGAGLELHEQGWRVALLEVVNEAGVEALLTFDSPNAGSVPGAPATEVADRWLEIEPLTHRPLAPTLSGLGLEHRPVSLYSRDAGELAATLEVSVEPLEGSQPDDRVATPERGRVIRLWDFRAGAGGWRSMHETRLEARDEMLVVETTGDDPWFGTDVRAVGGRMRLTFSARAGATGPFQVFWWTRARPQPDESRQRWIPMEGDDAWRERAVEIEVDGELAGIRIDPGTRPGTVAFDWIRLAWTDGASARTARAELDFVAAPSTEVTFRVRDENGDPTTAAFEIRDELGRVYPSQTKRLEPDFFFHPQVYRADGEVVRLPAGRYSVRASRGPESVAETRELVVGSEPTMLDYRVTRWIDPAALGWWSGDHHIHAAGCRHYEDPTQGVLPEAMARHIVGEDLKVGAALTWGPCFDFQKRFFTGAEDAVSSYPYILRYDIEVSGFGSHHSGHLCLLRLREQIPPGGDSKHHWPTLGLNTLRWAKRQGAVCGPAHSGAGLMVGRVGRVDAEDGPNGLPDFSIPRYDGIGANEFIVDITHRVPGPSGELVPAVDFISTMDTDRRTELNMWYHTLNCGFRVRASGETDFPCISGDRVGMGRVYVKLDGKLDYDAWCQGIAEGRSYVSDGLAHLPELAAHPVGAPRQIVEVGVAESELRLDGRAEVEIVLKAAARLPGRAQAQVELVVDGFPVASKRIPADGRLFDVAFRAPIERSSWLAVRIFPHAHTNPIFVIVDGRPVRASRASAEWCLRGVDQCWSQKRRFYAPEELADAVAAYEHARRVYQRILEESQR